MLTASSPSSLGALTSSFVTITTADLPSYKPSRFTVRSAMADGSTVLYNSLTGFHCTIPERHQTSLRAYLSKVGWTGNIDPLGEYLLTKGYIVKAALDEAAAWDIRYGNANYRSDHLELMLLASEDCNFRCVYCSQQFKRGSMQPVVRAGVMKLLDARIKSLNSLNIAWFGGEPLYGFDAIEELAPKIQEYTRGKGAVLSSSITTNAYLLTPEIAKKLLSWDVRQYQITLDGDAVEHDSHRPLKDGGSTFATILSNLIEMQKYDEPFSVALRVNADNSNSPKMAPLFEILSHHFGKDERFKMRFKAIGQWGGDNDAGLDVFCSKTEERQTLVQLRVDALQAGVHVESPAHDLAPNQVCYAARPYALIVGADGKLMKCSVVLDTMPANIVGQIHTDGSMTIHDELLLKWIKPFYKTDPECQKCFFLPSCQGASCPLPRFADRRPCPSAKMQIQQSLRDLVEFERVDQLAHPRT